MALIVLTGPDGCGKDTQIKLLADRLRAQGRSVHVFSVFDGAKKIFPTETKEAILLKVDPFMQSLTPESRPVFITFLLTASLADIKKSPETIIIYNGYCYKYWASEFAYGARVDNLTSLERLLPRPDLVLYIDTDLEITLKRKQRFSGYECGFAPAPNASEFYKFQQKVRESFQKLFLPDEAITIDGNLHREEVANAIWQTLEKKMPLREIK